MRDSALLALRRAIEGRDKKLLDAAWEELHRTPDPADLRSERQFGRAAMAAAFSVLLPLVEATERSAADLRAALWHESQAAGAAREDLRDCRGDPPSVR